jgi:hypothetical protein
MTLKKPEHSRFLSKRARIIAVLTAIRLIFNSKLIVR